jgi:hypothetical protein
MHIHRLNKLPDSNKETKQSDRLLVVKESNNSMFNNQ